MCVIYVIKIIHCSVGGMGNAGKSDASRICNLLIGVNPRTPESGVVQSHIRCVKVSLNLVFFF